MVATTVRAPMPGPARTATLSLLRKLIWDRLGLMTTAATYGDAVRVAIGPKTMYFFNHPEHAKHVLADNAANYRKGLGQSQARRALGDGLLTSDGELWRKQRRLIQPVFQSKRIADQAGVVVEEAAGLVDRLRRREGRGPVNVVTELTALTLGVLGHALLAADLDRFASIGHSFEAVQDQAMFEVVSLGVVPMWIPLPKQRRFRAARTDLQRVVNELVAERLAAGGRLDGDDVLSRLIAATRQETGTEAEQRMHDELVTLLLAGHETTASTLGWVFHLLSRNPGARARVHEEAVTVLGDRLPVVEDLHRLTFTTMVVEEAMRLYPPVWILPRQALADDVVGGHRVPAGADVLVSPYALHRHPRFWTDPERFRPHRFDRSAAQDRARYAYIPFGAGPRFCVGNQLGMMEAVLVTAMVNRELELTTMPGYRVVPEPMLSLRLRGGLPMTVRRAG
ncbi:MAG: cytochrome P450 [Frankiaceae bacterium]